MSAQNLYYASGSDAPLITLVFKLFIETAVAFFFLF